MTMRTRDDVLLLGIGRCAASDCLSSWVKICRACNLSFCGVHVENHSCGTFQRRVSFEGKGTPGAVRRSDVVSEGPGERAHTQRPQKGRSNAVSSIRRKKSCGKRKR